MKESLISLAILTAVLATPSSIYAEEEILCPQPYGNAVVCGVRHEAVDTGIAGNPALLGVGFLVTSGAFLYIVNKHTSSLIN